MMKTLHKSLTITFLAVSIFISGVTVDFVGAQDTAAGNAASRRSVDPLLSAYLKFRRLTTEDGLSSNQTFNIAQDKHGFMWFGTADGLSRYDGASIKVYRHDPDDPNSLVHNIVRAIGADSVLQKSILETDNLVLSYRERVFSFEFVALNYRAAEQNRYKYRMENFDDDWIETTGKRRFATYTNLDPGDYVFRVIGSNNDGIWNEEGASIRITVTPPWWGTIWFRVGMVVAAIALLFGGFRWRLSSIEASRRKLEIQVQRRTGELEAANREALEARNVAETANQAKSISR